MVILISFFHVNVAVSGYRFQEPHNEIMSPYRGRPCTHDDRMLSCLYVYPDAGPGKKTVSY